MASSRERDWRRALALALALAGCSVGHGDGEISGLITVPGCREGDFALNPSAFFAEPTEQLLRVSVQRGSDLVVRSDGLAVTVEDASAVKRDFLDEDLVVATDGPTRIDVTLYLNQSCPAERTKTPVVLSAVAGTIRFLEIYAPRVDKDDVRIHARFRDLRFEDPRDASRFAIVNGYFDFLYVRGSPAQRFP